MFDHEQIWAAFEEIAERCEMSLSALSKSAGLDPTSFNPSKRFGPGGRKRWPSTETLSRVLSVANMDMKTFAEILDSRSVPGSARPQPSRRRYKRVLSILEGRVRLEPHGPQLPCTIRDISASGARLWFPEPTELQGEFELEIPRLRQSLKARLVWSKDKSHGVMFLEELRPLQGDDVARLLCTLQTPDDWEHSRAAQEKPSPPRQRAPRKLSRG